MLKGCSLGILVCFALFLPTLAAGQPATKLLDINTAPLDPGPGSSGFISLRKAGDRLYFLGYRADLGGNEVWVSDGTPTGTQPLRTLCAGSCGNNPSLLGALGNLMLWIGDSESARQRLWRSDGTGPGTFALTEPGLRVQQVAFVGRFAWFSACSGTGTEEDCGLWGTDGSAAGTRLVHDAPGEPAWLHPVGDRLFYATGDSQGYDLWRTDGTAAGTVKLHRYESPTEPPHSPAAAGGRLFFIAWAAGREVWMSDGTAAGTRSLTAFEEDNPFGVSEWLKPVGGRVYFLAHDPVHGRELWRADGTTSGTVRVTDFEFASPFQNDERPSFLAAAGNTVVFLASDSLIQPPRLWSTGGTLESTAQLPDPCDDCSFDPSYGLTESGGKVFFLVQNPGQNQIPTDLWITDGSVAGTRRLKEVCPTCFIKSVFPWKGGALLVRETAAERDLWVSDGTAAGTKAFTRLAGSGSLVAENIDSVEELAGSAWFFIEGKSPGLWRRDDSGSTRQVFVRPAYGSGSLPERLAALGGKLVFMASDGASYRLWSSAGTPQATGPLDVPGLDLSAGLEDTTELVPAAGLLFFQAGHVFQEFDLWRTDGTVPGTIHLAHLPARSVMVSYQNALYFFTDRQIWRTDGTVAGTVKTGDFPENLAEVEFAAAGANGIYLKTVTLPYQTQFWFTDGTTAGTRQITSFAPLGVASGDPELTASGPWMYFSWQFRLWKSDGTPAGTTAVESLPGDEFPAKLLDHQGTLYFFMTSFDSTFPLQLWRTDGTPAGTGGTVRLATFPGQDSVVFPLKLTPFAGRVFFNVDDGVHGVELWSTDGTPAGTGLVRDLLPGFRSSKPTQLTPAAGKLFFSAADELHGRELWQSDGTSAGTSLVQDVAPQQVSSDPSHLTPAGDHLYFTADDDVAGREVWALPLSGAAPCQPSETRLCLGGRYAVEAVWRDFQGNQGVGRAVSLTTDTGYFWFFDPANVEVVLKVLDGRGVNDHVWVFYGALSSVEYTLTVTDTQTGLSRRYLNPSGQLASVADTNAFGPRGAREQSVAAASPLPLVERKKMVPAATTANCSPSDLRLCLNGDRFMVEVSWKDFQGNTGFGKAVKLTGDTGYFWFFNEENVEVVIKVLDGRPVNGQFWVFYGALSSVEYTVSVTDMQTFEVNTYRNPSGRLASVADTGAF